MPVILVNSETSELQRLKDQGRVYLKSNQLDKALKTYAAILRDHPEDVDTLLILGDSYLVAGDRNSAIFLYREAAHFAPDRVDIERRIGLAEVEPDGGETLPPGLSPTEPRAIAHLLRRLTGKQTLISENEVRQAEQLLNEVMHSASPAKMVSDRLDEIDALLPALIELNIRQARTEGRADLAETLEDIMANLILQVEPGEMEDIHTHSNKEPAKARPAQVKSVLVTGKFSHESPFRQALIVKTLGEQGYDVTTQMPRAGETWDQYDLVIAHNPHGNLDLMRGLAARAGARLPILVDLDVDFHLLPTDHPNYATLGLGEPGVARALTAALQLADCVTVGTEAAAESLQQAGYNPVVIPDGWHRSNLLWYKPAPLRTTLNLGLMLMQGQLEDAASIRRAVVRILREFPQSRLVISGDPKVYQLFDSVPDTRRMFLPPVEMEDYPYLLAQFDFLLAPLRDIPYNHQRSDRILVEAGVRRIPWIASPVRPYLNWASGGLIASSLDEWYTHLRGLMQDHEMRLKLGQAGYQKALQRELQPLGKSWHQLIQQLLSSHQGRR
jgi:tetratricopeptide (TPR) repeat protein